MVIPRCGGKNFSLPRAGKRYSAQFRRSRIMMEMRPFAECLEHHFGSEKRCRLDYR